MTDGTTFSMGGGGGQSFSFGPQGAQPGAYVQGTILDMKEVQSTSYDKNEPEFWPNGDPKMQYRVTLQTELRDPANPSDDGRRDVYLDGRRRPNENGTKSKTCAVLDAVRATTGTTDLEYGAKLTLRWISGMGFTGDPRCYEAWYERPAMPLTQPPEHRAAAPQAAPGAQFGSPADNSFAPAPAWSQPPAAAHTPPPGPPAAPVAPPPQAQIPGATPGPDPWPTAQQPPAAPVAPAASTGPHAHPGGWIPRETIAAQQAAGIDPTSVYGPGWEQRVGP